MMEKYGISNAGTFAPRIRSNKWKLQQYAELDEKTYITMNEPVTRGTGPLDT